LTWLTEVKNNPPTPSSTHSLPQSILCIVKF
jgi:hypothetical protein